MSFTRTRLRWPRYLTNDRINRVGQLHVPKKGQRAVAISSRSWSVIFLRMSRVVRWSDTLIFPADGSENTYNRRVTGIAILICGGNIEEKHATEISSTSISIVHDKWLFLMYFTIFSPLWNSYDGICWFFLCSRVNWNRKNFWSLETVVCFEKVSIVWEIYVKFCSLTIDEI